ncbi:tetratricopeptide repeat protein [bacterium]|nr:MAG: tetratricopeptide repeat protein [bacterium]
MFLWAGITNRMNRNALTAFIGIAILVVIAYYYFQFSVREHFPGENKYRLANKYLEDGKYEEALEVFDQALVINPSHKVIRLGRGIALMEGKRYDESREEFDRAIELDENFAEAYANRGILNDRTGEFRLAVKDYRQALELKPDLAKGPGWLWRFLRNVQKKPPSIADRADYIEGELKKPENERLLRIPEVDAQQRMYRP